VVSCRVIQIYADEQEYFIYFGFIYGGV